MGKPQDHPAYRPMIERYSASTGISYSAFEEAISQLIEDRDQEMFDARMKIAKYQIELQKATDPAGLMFLFGWWFRIARFFTWLK